MDSPTHTHTRGCSCNRVASTQKEHAVRTSGLLMHRSFLFLRRYKVPERQPPIFATRDALLAYESALSVAESVQEALEAKEYQQAEAAAAEAVAAVLAGSRRQQAAVAEETQQQVAPFVGRVKAEKVEPGGDDAAPVAAACAAGGAPAENVQAAFARQFTPATLWAGAHPLLSASVLVPAAAAEHALHMCTRVVADPLPPRTHAGVATVAVSLLERRRDYNGAVALLQALLAGSRSWPLSPRAVSCPVAILRLIQSSRAFFMLFLEHRV